MFDEDLNIILPSYRCVYCGEDKPGQFVRPFSGPRNGWDRGTHHGVWCCHDCATKRDHAVRLGQARGLLQLMYDDLSDVHPTDYVEWLRRVREWLDGT